MKVRLWSRAAAVAPLVCSIACGGTDFEADVADQDGLESADSDGSDASGARDVEALGSGEQSLLGDPTSLGLDMLLPSSCQDPSGLESVLAALGVATATELRRWQPLKDFAMKSGFLTLTATGKAQCSDGRCFNTQAILDLQKDAAKAAQIRSGVYMDPALFRRNLAFGMLQQSTCHSYNPTSMILPLIGCKVDDHRFVLESTSRGTCDMNYWFAVTTPAGAPLPSLDKLKSQLLWLGVDDNSYIEFQTSGNKVGIDPTYGLNAAGATATGSCSAACTKISSTNIASKCCSCNGATKRYVRSSWSTTTYVCQ